MTDHNPVIPIHNNTVSSMSGVVLVFLLSGIMQLTNTLFCKAKTRSVARSNKVGWTIWGGVSGEVSPPQSRVDLGRGLYPYPEKNSSYEGMFWRILSELVWRLPRSNSLQFWCVHAVTN